MIDDVLYTGMRRAGARRNELSVRVRRCGLTMSDHAQFVGLTLDVRPDWVMHCEVPPFEPEWGISIAHHDAVLNPG